MSRNWRPDRSDWNAIENYGAPERRARWVAAGLVLGAVALGLIGGAAWQRWNAPTAAANASAIEWNAVQTVPTRTPDAEDNEWQERADALDNATEAPAPANQNEASPTR